MRISTLIPLLGLLAVGYAKQCPRQRTSPGKEILCYTSSNNAEELMDGICKCTTLVHQGHQLHDLSTSGIEELQKTLKEANPVLQIVISVTDPQGTLKTSATTRQEASGRLANVLSQVDGVELDMGAGSKERLTHFLKGLKDEMIRKSNDKRIILALPTKVEDLAKQYDLKSLAKYVDLFTLSTDYLVDDKESFKTFHPSRLMGIFDVLNTDSLVDLVSGMGVPKKKLLVSVPASAYKFTLKNENDTMPGSLAKEESPEVISQKELCDLMSAGEWTVERDSDLTAPYAFKDSTWIAYEDKSSVGIKGKYVLLRELAGLGIHEIENDSENDCGKPVIHEVHRSFTEMKRKTRGAVLASLENDLHHQLVPQSRHVRSSEFRIVRVVDTAGAIHAIRENTQTEFTCTRQGFFVHPKSCNRFYRCVKFDQGVDDYSVYEFDCPAGLAFDERTEVCVWPGSITEGSPCPGSSEIAPVPRARFQCPERDGYYADPQNCRWFFACFHLGEPEPTAYEFRCPFGLVFNEEKLICDWPWLVPSCGASGYSRTEYGGTGYVGLGYGDYTNSAYPGSKPSESRQSETEFGKYSGGAAINGANYPGQGFGLKGTQSGFINSGAVGSGQFGVGSGSIHSGSGELGNGQFGLKGYQGSGSGSGASGSGQFGGQGGQGSGSVAFGNGHFRGQGSGSVAFGNGHFGGQGSQGSGSGNDGEGHSGLVVELQSNAGSELHGSSGSEHGGSVNSGLGVTNAVYSGSDASGSKYSNQGGNSAHTAGIFGATEFGSNHQSSSGSGSGSTQFGYNSGQTASTNAFNGLGNTAVVVEHETPGSVIYQTGSTGSGHSAGGGQYTGSSFTANRGSNVFGNTKYGAAGENSQGFGQGGVTVSLHTGGSQGGSYSSDSGYVSGNQGNNGYNSGATAGSTFSSHGNGAYSSSSEGVSDAQDVINNGYNSGFTGNTGHVYVNRGNTAFTASNEGTSDSQDVINGKYNSGSAYSGVSGSNGDYSSFDKDAFNSFGSKVTGAASPAVLVQSVTPGYTVVTSGVGQDHTYDGGSVTGSGYYTGSTGSGNVAGHQSNYHHGVVSVTPAPSLGITLVNSGAGNEGGISYVETGSTGTINGFGKGGISSATTTYHGNSGSSAYGTQSGNAGGLSQKGIQTGFTGFHGNEFGIKTTNFGAGASVSDQNEGYKTTEYEGNGGRGTVTFNNGYSASKFTESDVRKQTKGGGSAGFTGYTSQGFTKTGPTKTGFTTAQIGGSGSYVTGGGYHSNPTPTPGSNVFLEHSTADFSIGNEVNNLAQVTPSDSPDSTYVDTSKINLGHTSSGVSSGYQYKKPSVPFVTGSITASTPPPLSVTYHEPVVPLTVTTPSPFLNVEVYNTPSVVTSAPITAAPAVVNTYSTVSTGYQYKKPTIYQRPTIHTPTPSPIGYVTGPAEVYKSTLLEAAKQPFTVSTVAPVYDNGFKTVISSTISPIADTTGQYYYSDSRYQTDSGSSNGQTSGRLDIAYQQPEVNFQKEYVGSKPTQNTIYQTSGGSVQHTSSYRRPVNTQTQYTATPTPAPIAYVTGPADVYKSTLFEAAKQPFTVSTVAPVYDNGFMTVISSTASPIAETTGQYFYSDSRFNSDSGSTNGQTSGHLDVTYQNFNSQKEFVSSTPVPNTKGGYTYEKPKTPFNYDSPATATPTVTVHQQGQYVPVSTVTPNFDVTYDKPSPSIRPAFTQKTTGQKGYDVKSSEGYVYSKPTMKFVTPTAAPVYTESERYSYTNEGSSTNYNRPRDGVKVNLNRGGIRFTPQADYIDYNNGNTGFRTKGFGSTVTYKTYASTTPVSIKTNSYSDQGSIYADGDSSSSSRPANVFTSSTPSYEGSKIKSSIGKGNYGSYNSANRGSTYADGSGSSSYRPSNVFTSSTPSYEVSSAKTSTGQRGYGSYTSDTRGSSYSDGSGSFGYRPSKVFTSSTPSYEVSSIKSTFENGAYGKYDSGNQESTYVDGSGSSSYRPSSVYTASTPLYQVSTVKSPTSRGKGKVIVKLSDLHPLLLGKLGAQCTCRSDPFETLRGPGAKLIKSSRGDIDLKQYDESDVYVDLDTDRLPSKSTAVDRISSGSSTASPPAYSSSFRTPVTAVFGLSTPRPNGFRSRGKPSTTYLPVSSSASPIIVPLEKGDYESSDTLDPQFVNRPAGFVQEGVPVGRSSGIKKTKSGKALGTPKAGGNAIAGAGAAFDRYGPGGLRGVDETLQGGADCARPGLFRHPKFCNKFYACHWDEWKQKYTLHVFNCPVHLSFDGNAGACNWPSKGPACQDDNLLV